MDRAGLRLAVMAVLTACTASPDGAAQVADPEEQMAQALLAAPADKADGARLLGWTYGGELVELRPGTTDITCQASNPANERFSTSCYHSSLEPYFARGRELDREGAARADRYRIRFEEMESGQLAMPAPFATQYVFDGTWNADTRTGDGQVRWVIYVPGATAESTGLSSEPQEDAPWIMMEGTPGAHVMPPRGRDPGQGEEGASR